MPPTDRASPGDEARRLLDPGAGRREAPPPVGFGDQGLQPPVGDARRRRPYPARGRRRPNVGAPLPASSTYKTHAPAPPCSATTHLSNSVQPPPAKLRLASPASIPRPRPAPSSSPRSRRASRFKEPPLYPLLYGCTLVTAPYLLISTISRRAALDGATARCAEELSLEAAPRSAGLTPCPCAATGVVRARTTSMGGPGRARRPRCLPRRSVLYPPTPMQAGPGCPAAIWVVPPMVIMMYCLILGWLSSGARVRHPTLPSPNTPRCRINRVVILLPSTVALLPLWHSIYMASCTVVCSGWASAVGRARCRRRAAAAQDFGQQEHLCLLPWGTKPSLFHQAVPSSGCLHYIW